MLIFILQTGAQPRVVEVPSIMSDMVSSTLKHADVRKVALQIGLSKVAKPVPSGGVSISTGTPAPAVRREYTLTCNHQHNLTSTAGICIKIDGLCI